MSDSGRIDAKTKLMGFIASPASHSISPIMQNMAHRKLGLNNVFMAFDVNNERLADALTGLKALGVRGFSVSMPNKMAIIPLLDELAPEAQLIGAVNTVVNENGKLIGHNFDGIGYMRSLTEEGVAVVGKKMTLLGAGGAGTAIAIQAAMDGVAKISIFNRDDEFFPRALDNAKKINEQMKDTNCKATVYRLEDEERLKQELASSDILTNSTNVGMKDLEGQTLIPDASWLRPELVVSDIIYNPRVTKLMEQGHSVGCKTINGLGMVLWQGAVAFKKWTGEDMPVDYIIEQIFD